MKKRSSLLTTITIMIVAISIPVTLLILQTGSLDFRFQAFDSPVPEHILVSDIDQNSVKISWATEKPTIGGVTFANITRAPITDSEPTSYHSFVIDNLNPGQIYQYFVTSDGDPYYNNGANYEISPATVAINSSGANYLVYGQVFSSDGIAFQQEGIISINIRKNGQESQRLTTNLNQAGGYQFNLKNLLDASLAKEFPYSGEVDVALTVYVAGQEPILRSYTYDFAKGRQLPTIFLGELNLETIPGINGSET